MVAPPTEDVIRRAMTAVIDPELGADVVDLGMYQGADIDPSGVVTVHLALTTAACPLRNQLRHDAEERLAHLRHLQDIHDHQDAYWRQIDQAAARASSTGYDEATRLLVELREAANHFKEDQQFQTHFHTWIRSHLRRPALLKRLQNHNFTLPET